jgi:murein DD-endopeptidase MepM/ murein hydrolase activator NlpD
VLNGKPGSRHQGADFRATTGTPVRAPNAGIVVLASDLYFAGNTVVLDHGCGLVSLFAHLSRMAVETGNRVGRGDLLGEAGATGRVTGPHLHWAMRLHGTSVDPLSLSVAVADLQD